MIQGERLVDDLLLTIDDMDGPTGVPGWTYRRVLARCNSNAVELAAALATAHGRPHSVILDDSSPAQPEGGDPATGDIDELLRRRDFTRARLVDEVARLPDTAWNSMVTVPGAGLINTSRIPWLRTRELYLRAADLGTTMTLDDLPDDIVDALLADAVGELATEPELRSSTAGWLIGGELTRRTS